MTASASSVWFGTSTEMCMVLETMSSSLYTFVSATVYIFMYFKARLIYAPIRSTADLRLRTLWNPSPRKFWKHQEIVNKSMLLFIVAYMCFFVIVTAGSYGLYYAGVQDVHNPKGLVTISAWFSPEKEMCIPVIPVHLTIVVAVSDTIVSLTLLSLFIAPLVNTGQAGAGHRGASQRAGANRAIVRRNLVACVIAVGSTFMFMIFLIASWYMLQLRSCVVPIGSIDTTINVACVMYSTRESTTKKIGVAPSSSGVSNWTGGT